MPRESVSLREYLEVRIEGLSAVAHESRNDVKELRKDVTSIATAVNRLQAQQTLRASDWGKVGVIAAVASAIIAAVLH